MSMTVPCIEYGRLSPMLIVFGAAVVGLLVEAFVAHRNRYSTQLALAAGGLVLALVAVGLLAGHHGTAVMGSVAVDGPALFLQATILSLGIAAVGVIAERHLGAFASHAATIPGSLDEQHAERAGITQTEVFPLAMLSTGGMLLFPVSNDLLTMFVALEVLSLPLYLMCGLARCRRLLSQEAALKYFLLGAFSSALFLYGIAMLYGYADTLTVPGIGAAITKNGGTATALIGAGLLTVGLLFKIGAVPFHSWVPDVYQGAPTPITGFMAAATKIAAFGALLRILTVALPGLTADWRPILVAVTILTMIVASVLTVTQTELKRLLAYSSIANAGFILIGVIAAKSAGLSSTMFYLVSYGFSTLGAFAVISLARNTADEEDTEISRWAGLGRRAPLVAATLALFLLAMAGIPLTSGFISKFVVFQAAMSDGGAVLVVVGVISSAIAAFAYIRIIVMMYFTDPPADPPHVRTPSALTAAAVAAGVAVTVLLGIAPQPLLDLANQAGLFLR
ncbi:NADH-quinone oxidoreductase subunit NuoN [Mycobacterium xenopi]|uniref:NADH-quinone oxidoreductase subunit NuoN n=1 Tax=Mycobacterium xenopi TaxID=1789 RepID=UPI0022EA7986|nr:NADH-quinone oxidoreductase subunit NuoN [Mycobacterium xenopi]MDA3659404.1 NADH-quinone oxidoreductase subunit NuoN [Mycobacterium xenopi]